MAFQLTIDASVYVFERLQTFKRDRTFPERLVDLLPRLSLNFHVKRQLAKAAADDDRA